MVAFLFHLAKAWGNVDDSWQPKGSSAFSDVTDKIAHYRDNLSVKHKIDVILRPEVE